MTPFLLIGMALLASPSLGDPADAKAKCQNDPNCYWWTGADSPFKKASLKNEKSYANNPFLNGGFKPAAAGAAFPSPDYSKNPFLMFAANGSRVGGGGFLGVQPRPFAASLPAARCDPDKVCVRTELCRGGVTKTTPDTDAECDLNDHVCCALSNDIADPKIDVRLAADPQGPSNLSFLTQNDTKVPGPLFKVTGGAGLSPAVIQVLPVEINNAGEFGQSHLGESTSKPAREIPIRTLGGYSTPDYSNVNFGDAVRFASTIRGPAYLPPIGGPTPSSPSIPELEVPVSTYQPKIPSTPKPPPRPFTPTGSQSINRYSTQKPQGNGYLPPPPPTRPQPVPQPTNQFPSSSQRPYIPPASNNINNQYKPFPTTRPTPPTQRTTYYQPTFTTQRPRPPSTFIPVQPSSYRPVTSPTPGYKYPSPSTQGYTYTKPQGGYSYPSPTPAFTFPTPQPSPSNNFPSSVNPTRGYEYPKPTPQFTIPTVTGSPSNQRPSVQPFPRPTTQPNVYLPPSTTGYQYPSPNLDGQAGNNNNQYIPPPTTKRPEVDREGSGSSDQGVKLRPYPDQSQNREVAVPPAGCAAALKCVQEIYCTADGFVSPVPVVLSKGEADNKVPTTSCRDISSGTDGVCCRDPNYKDPWPSANLVNGFDDGQYREDDSIAQYNNKVVRSSRPSRSQPEEICGARNYNTQPRGPTPLNTNFAEIPWQAMILRESNRSLLCGGAIIKRNAVLTTASCVEGLPTSDILIKGGEWKLGIDEEPLPFQIVKTAAILPHPGYKKGSKVNDLAIVFLDEKLRLAKNIGTICLPEPNQIPTRNCLTTGWGKRILQLHAKGAIMRAIETNIMDNAQCGDVLKAQYPESHPHYSPNTLCGFSPNDQCKVDYGSALACSNENDQYVLSGIFSWDTGCKDENQIGGYVAPDVEWISAMLDKPIKELRRLDKQIRS